MQWQPIETAPKDGTEIIVFEKGGVICTAYWESGYFGHSGWTHHQSRSDVDAVNPSHWMPLPNPPSLEAGEDDER